MRRIDSCVVLAVSLASASKVAAHDDDKVTPPLKPNDSDKSAAKGSEKDVVQLELHELRNLVEAQSEELRDLRSRLAAVEGERAASKAGSSPPLLRRQRPFTSDPGADFCPIDTGGCKCPGSGGGQNEPKSPLYFRIGSAEFSKSVWPYPSTI